MRELRETQTHAKNQGRKTQTNPVSLKASIDDADIRIILTVGWIEYDWVHSIAEKQTGERLIVHFHREDSSENLSLILEVVSKVHMNMAILEVEN